MLGRCLKGPVWMESTWTERLGHQQAAESCFISFVLNADVFSSLALEECGKPACGWLPSLEEPCSSWGKPALLPGARRALGALQLGLGQQLCRFGPALPLVCSELLGRAPSCTL